MIIDTMLQAAEAPILHVPSDGSNIGGVDPKRCGWWVGRNRDSELLLFTEGNGDPSGKGYPAVMWSIPPRPILGSSGRFAMSFEFEADRWENGDVFETDTILVVAGVAGIQRKYNLSLQMHCNNRQIDVGNWTNAGVEVPFVYGSGFNEARVEYAYDLGNQTCAVVSYTINGNTVPIPVAVATQQATETDWTVGAIPQIQLGSLPEGKPWAVTIRNLQYEW